MNRAALTTLVVAYLATACYGQITLPTTTGAPTTEAPTTGAPTTGAPTTGAPTTSAPTTGAPTTGAPTTSAPTTGAPTTSAPTTSAPTTGAPTTSAPTTSAPTTGAPTTSAPTTKAPITTPSPTTISSFICSADKVGYTYPADNPLEYYTCLDATTPILFTCVQGSGYINNNQMQGCVPWVLWECTYKRGPPACNADQQLTKFPHKDPTMYWNCQGVGIPEAVSCPTNTAFISSGPNAGCQPWAIWSEYCPS